MDLLRIFDVLVITVAPAWYQTIWFQVFWPLVFVLVVWVVYRWRVRQMADSINARFNERLAERTRLARELHDTFLQTIQGSKLVADDALERPDDSARMLKAMQRLSQWLGQATEEGRAALSSLQTSTTEANDLVNDLRNATPESRFARLKSFLKRRR